MSLTDLFILILIVAILTFLFRCIPFILPNNIIQNPFVINFGKKLPSGIMLILFLYSTGLSEEHIDSKFVTASFLAAIPVTLIYIWKRNAVFSILFGVLFFYIF